MIKLTHFYFRNYNTLMTGKRTLNTTVNKLKRLDTMNDMMTLISLML